MERVRAFMQRITPSTTALIVAGVVVVLVIGVGIGSAVYARVYDNHIFPGVRVLGVHVGGLTKEDARKNVQEAVDAALEQGLRFRYHGHEAKVDVTTDEAAPDASHDLIQYDIDTAINAAFSLGRDHGFIWNTVERFHGIPLNMIVRTSVDTPAIEKAIRTAFQSQIQEPRDAQVQVMVANGAPSVTVNAEQIGAELVMTPVLNEVARQASRLAFVPIEMTDRVMKPDVKADDLRPLIPEIESYLKRPGLQFTYETMRFSVPIEQLASWVSVTGTRDQKTVTLDPEHFAKGIHELARDIEREQQNGNLSFVDGKIQAFTAGIDGVVVDTDALYTSVITEWPATSTFPLVIKTLPATLVGDDPERLGIKELIGTGTSNFSGSPTNRRKNIQHGADLVNGTIVPPGETFSLIKTLGPIDGEHDWLSELVIKGNQTKPEFGGGLCQIGTTTFRAALKSGLPIVERQNHSYRVRYYEPAGTDATIYDPKPDFRFLNDTAHPIYIHAYIKGDDAFFEFWGTRDGRVSHQTEPRIFNIVPPPPTKIVETLELPVGQKKCTETAHAGADAEFKYTVTYADGTVKQTDFQSHYRPWQAVCQVGVAQLSTTTTEM